MFGDRLYELRKQKKLSRQALADYMGVTATSVYKWENNMSEPSIAAMQRLCELFGVTMDQLCAADMEAKSNLQVLTRAFVRLSPEEQEKYLAVGRALYASAFEQESRG